MLVLVSSIIYARHKTKAHAIIGLGAGTAAMAAVMVFANMWIDVYKRQSIDSAKARYREKIDIPEDELIDCLKKGMTNDEMAEYFKCSSRTITRRKATALTQRCSIIMRTLRRGDRKRQTVIILILILFLIQIFILINIMRKTT